MFVAAQPHLSSTSKIPTSFIWCSINTQTASARTIGEMGDLSSNLNTKKFTTSLDLIPLLIRIAEWLSKGNYSCTLLPNTYTKQKKHSYKLQTPPLGLTQWCQPWHHQHLKNQEMLGGPLPNSSPAWWVWTKEQTINQCLNLQHNKKVTETNSWLCVCFNLLMCFDVNRNLTLTQTNPG